jgi:hypothetical protein
MARQTRPTTIVALSPRGRCMVTVLANSHTAPEAASGTRTGATPSVKAAGLKSSTYLDWSPKAGSSSEA